MFLNTFALLLFRFGPGLRLGNCASDSRCGSRNIRFCRSSVGLRVFRCLRGPCIKRTIWTSPRTQIVYSAPCGFANTWCSRSGRWELTCQSLFRNDVSLPGRLGVAPRQRKPIQTFTFLCFFLIFCLLNHVFFFNRGGGAMAITPKKKKVFACV